MIDFDALVLAPIHDPSLFGERALWVPATGPAILVNCVFTEHASQTTFQGGDEVTNEKPIANIRTAAAAVMPGDLLRIRDILWVVENANPDGHGDCRLMLRPATIAEARKVT